MSPLFDDIQNNATEICSSKDHTNTIKRQHCYVKLKTVIKSKIE